MNGFDRVKNFLAWIGDDKIFFKQHFYERTIDRPISEGLVRKSIKMADSLLKIEEQQARKPTEKKYKLWIRLSSRYCLVLIVTIEEKNLYIITGWTSEGKWQNKKEK